MAIDFNTEPYFDDYNPEKDFYRILFRPSYAVQARELTQSQSILSNQIDSFAKNIFQEGSVVTGAAHQLDDSVFYIKVQPTFTSGSTIIQIDFSQFEGNYLVEESTGKIGYIKSHFILLFYLFITLLYW